MRTSRFIWVAPGILAVTLGAVALLRAPGERAGTVGEQMGSGAPDQPGPASSGGGEGPPPLSQKPAPAPAAPEVASGTAPDAPEKPNPAAPAKPPGAAPEPTTGSTTQALAGTPDAVAAAIPGSRASGHWKFVPAQDAPVEVWHQRIAELREKRSVVALAALVDAIPAGSERQRLLTATTAALASLGAEARPAFDDLLGVSQPREVRLAAINAFSRAFPAERGAVLAAWAQEADAVIRAKALALREARK